MSTFQRLTLIGLYAEDPSLFDTVTLPEGYDADTFRDTLLLEHGEKCVLYTDPVFFKFSLGAVSRKWSLELSRIYEALIAEYNPIYNYDRFEEWEDKGDRSHDEKVKADYKNTRTPDLSDVTTNDTTDTTTYDTTETTSQTTDGTTERQVAAFNSSTYEPSEKTIVNNGIGDTSKTGDETLERTGTVTQETTGTDEVETKGTLEDRSGKDNESSHHTGHVYGNVGVTTSTKMIGEILDQRLNKNLYEIAARIFANELLIQIY